MPEIEQREVDELVDEAISKHRNVKDILIEMKDTSELMVDLAYSALLTNSKAIAEEVRELERRMDELEYEIMSMLMLAAKTPEGAADLSGILRVALATEDIADAAENITNVVVRGIGDHPIYQSILDETEEQVVKTRVGTGSGLIGKTLGELEMKTTVGCYIRAVRRGRRWIYDPNESTRILESDLLIASGVESAVDKLEEMAKGNQSSPK